MPIKTREQLEERFQDGDVPTQEDFIDVFDSYFHLTEDGVYKYEAPDSTLRFGAGITTPDSRVGIKELPTGSFLSFHKTDNTSAWEINRIVSPVNAGLSISELTPGGSLSRLFLQETNGRIGMGTTLPGSILEVNEANADAATTITFVNTAASSVHPGWQVGHVHNTAITDKNGAFSIFEAPAPAGSALERMTILAGGRMGVNETLPDNFLHVSANVSDPLTPNGLQEHTGIMQVGPVTDSLVFDHEGLLKRTAVYSPALTFSVGTLQLQKEGGALLVHGKTSTPETEKVFVDVNGDTGIGILDPQAKLHVNGRIVVGDTTGETPIAGTLRWFNGDFEGFDGTNWVSLTGGLGFWAPAGTDMITYNATDAKVGIGIAVPVATLDVNNDSVSTQSSGAARIVNTGTTSGMSITDIRAGLGISCTGAFNASLGQVKNIGLLVSAVNGQNANANMAAVLNGNTVIGAVTPDNDMVGTNGTRVLVLQQGTIPASTVPGPQGTSANAIQIFVNSNAIGTSFFNVMNSDGHTVSLYKQNPLPDRNENTVGGTYTGNEQEIIANLRSRLDTLESRLAALGFFDTSGILP
jgi:hypothetical protein